MGRESWWGWRRGKREEVGRDQNGKDVFPRNQRRKSGCQQSSWQQEGTLRERDSGRGLPACNSGRWV